MTYARHKDKYHMISLIRGTYSHQIHGDRNSMVVVWGWGGRGSGELLLNGYIVSALQDETFWRSVVQQCFQLF